LSFTILKEIKKGNQNMRNYFQISGSTLKLIALVSMLIDHTAAVLFPSLMMDHGVYYPGFSMEYAMAAVQESPAGWLYVFYQIMRRILGRLAFPIYCFLLVEGFERTRSRAKYAFRLFLFALISEIPFDLAFSGRTVYTHYQNVFFTLLLGFLMMWAMKELEARVSRRGLRWAGIGILFLALSFLAEAIYCDYGAYGIIAIALLYLFRKNRKEQIIAGMVAFLWEVTAPLSFIFVAFYNGERGLKLKYIFYLFYPLHLLVLYFLLRLIL